MTAQSKSRAIENSRLLAVDDLEVQLVRKDIRTLRLAVRPPDGRVLVSAPHYLSEEYVCQAVLTKLRWIRKQQARLDARPLPLPSMMVTGESHYLFDQCFTLELVERSGRHRVHIQDEHTLVLTVTPGTTPDKRVSVMNEWYRNRLKEQIPGLLAKWQPLIGREVMDWGIKRMKSRWGTCNVRAQRIWLNLELARRPMVCLEYVLVHELVHLLERSHNQRFKSLMDGLLPEWRAHRALLNSMPII